MDQPRTEEQARAALERRLRRPVRTNVWAHLVRGQWVSDVIDHGGSFEVLVTEYCALDELKSDEPAPRKPKRAVTPPTAMTPPTDRLEIIGQLVAERLNRDPHVTGFRSRHLPDGLLRPDAVADWISEQRQRDGRSTVWGALPLDEDLEPVPHERTELLGRRFLTYRPAPPGRVGGALRLRPSGWQVATTAGGALERLRLMSERFSRSYGWDEASATSFVLTGIPPQIPGIRVSLRRCFGTGDVGHLRLVLDVDVRVPPAHVAATYARIRDERKIRRPRVRRAKRPRAVLVQFVRDHWGKNWEERMAEWNRSRPEERYTAASNMRRDYGRAMKIARNK